jgi:hypothetical protein
VCFVHCASTASDTDVYVDISQTAHASGTFIAHVVQSQPSAVDMTFTDVTASWSGHFFNFQDVTTYASLPLYFHTLASGPSSIANIEVYVDPNTYLGGPVHSSVVSCTTLGN